MDRTDDVAAYQLVQEALLSPEERIISLIASLPVLNKHSKGVDADESCPICLMPLSSVFEEEENGKEKVKASHCEDESPEEDEFALQGVTKLVGCGHIFCRRDLIEWIRSRHGSCPTCRNTFLDIRPPSDSDEESSDGGEYIPNPEDFEDEDEDAYIDYDGFDTDAEDFPVQTMDIDFDDMWEGETENEEDIDEGAVADAEMDETEEDDTDVEDASSEWGLTDGESESMSSSEGDLTMADLDARGPIIGAALETDVNVSVHEDDDDLNGEKEEGLITHTNTVADSQVPK